jgi:type I restriction enzyme S subunit
MTIKLGEICDFLPGFSWKANAFQEKGIPIIRINNMNSNDNDFVYWQEYYDKKYIIEKGDLLLSLSGTIKVFKWDGPDALLNQRIVKISTKDKEKVNIDWIYYQLTYAIEKISNTGKQAVIKNVSVNNIKSFEVELPNIHLQNKLVGILDKTSSLIVKKENSIKLLNNILKSKYLEEFGEKAKIKIRYNTLEHYTLKITDGTHQSPKFTQQGIPFLLISNIINNEIDYSTKKYISKADYENLNKRTPIEVGDILITSVGSYGNPALVKTITKFAFQRHIAYVKPNNKLINSIFLFEVLKSDFTKFQIEKVVKGVAQKTLNLSELKKIKIPIISIKSQNEFAEFAKGIYKKKEILNRSLFEIKELFSSIMQRAFNGQLNFNIDFELEALIKEIDLQKKCNNLKEIEKDIAYLQRLIDKLNTQDFNEKEMYDKAKTIAFQLMNESENKRRVTQEYDEKTKNIKLSLV